MSFNLKLASFFNISSDLFALELPDSVDMLLGEEYKNWFRQFVERKGFFGKSIINGKVDHRAVLDGDVYVSEGAIVEPFAMVKGPCFLAPGVTVRHAAYIRGYVYAGENCVIGHATEVKESFLFPGAKAAHFAYIGNSIIGKDANLGAGVKIANLKLKKDIISILSPRDNKPCSTGLNKMGAIVGDSVQVGCNAVLSPGSLLFPHTGVFPAKHFYGTLSSGFAK